MLRYVIHRKRQKLNFDLELEKYIEQPIGLQPGILFLLRSCCCDFSLYVVFDFVH